jgi:hypothetical protein
MDRIYLIAQLENIKNAKRENRLRVAQLVLKNECLFPFLLEIVFENNNKTTIKAAWVLELVCEQQLDLLAPYLNYFTSNISNLKNDSAVRAISKICGFLAKSYSSKTSSIIKKEVTSKHIEKIIEAGFDWLINEHKVAIKVYAMEHLYFFGETKPWVKEELQLIIEQNITKESPAYKARGKKILSLINKK